MTVTARAIVGGLIGALITLAIHPSTRGFFVSPMPTARIEAAPKVVPSRPPATLADAARWIELACEKIRATGKLRPAEYESAVRVLVAAQSREPDNAYWPQLRAAILLLKGDRSAALRTWKRARRCQRWDDHQSAHLAEIRRNLQRKTGTRQSWQAAYAYYQRRQAPAQIIAQCAQSLLNSASFDTAEGLELRYATVVGGDLMRSGAKQIVTGDFGVQIVDYAAYPSELVTGSRPKRLYLGRTLLANNLRRIGRATDADLAFTIFQNNDGWTALVTRPDPVSQNQTSTVASLVAGSVPRASLWIVGAGALLWLLGVGGKWLLARGLPTKPDLAAESSRDHAPDSGTETSRPDRARIIRRDQITGVSMLLGLTALTFALTQSWLATVPFAIAGSSLLLIPRQVRPIATYRGGRWFSLANWIWALVVSLFVGALTMSYAYVGNALLPYIEGAWYGRVSEVIRTQPQMVQALALLAGVPFVLAGMAGFVRRVRPLVALAESLRLGGWALVLWGLGLGILSAPACLVWDQQLDRAWEKRIANEPVYYLQQ
ncbi:MAG: hypothetical protein SFX74_12360 [Fimbriimonadaceae bacterium]|nr:hypothetical protein [Fimbriimonadaceae bacterium]